jgi:uncharacterized phage protein gp47/JayE
MASIGDFVTKNAVEIKTDILRTIKNGLIKQGVGNPNVGPNSDWAIIAESLGNELEVVHANTIIKADQQMPDTAVGEDLAREAALLELEKQGAAGSIGGVVLVASQSTPIITGAQLTDAAGLAYEVVTGGTYANGATVPIRAVSTGAATNHAEGDILTWVNAPPYSEDKAAVAAGGLTNGIDAEDDEILRSRVLAVYRTPPGAGNWEHVAELAEEGSASVDKAFVYPAIQGPGTVHVAVSAAPTATNKSRVLAAAKLAGDVEPYVKGKLPEHAHVVVTTVYDVNVDVAIGLSLPEATTASPPGPGGGWINGTPWPAPDGTNYFRHQVSAVTSETQFTVNAQTAPTANVTRIAWLSPSSWKLFQGLVTSVSGTAGAYLITVDTPFTGITTDCVIWPDCQNAQTYADAIIASFALMGPGEKTSNASALVRGFRHPTAATGDWPSALGPAVLRKITEAGDEVRAAQFLWRNRPATGADDAALEMTGASGKMEPPVPAALTDAPRVLTPRHFGFYRIA